ncbi:formimidoylglutamase [Leptolyngbya sp. 7M]|uniref:formimidoylglutamase n=1 Tax=Leptolyngbya sp. 7M TaxID=2812896 RepID=UPI001B8D9AF0|nr:formimidoylglutamase [Leptolyngbya sp. 7M]QYO65554.1 formimidoylglutamase [Leptolyngbya sp. 7M]
MTSIFELTTRPAEELFFSRGDRNDPRLGETVGRTEQDYEKAEIVILGCPQDEGVRRNNGREGAALAPFKIREQFYKLTTFNINGAIVDIGDVKIADTLEKTHETHFEIVKQALSDGKKLIVIGGGNDVSYPDGKAMSEVFGVRNWIAINVDAQLDVRLAEQRNSGTPYRQLLDEELLLPRYFYEVGFQSHFCSPIYYEYIRSLGVHRISLELLRSRSEPDQEIKEQIRQNFINHSSSMSTFFGFDLDVVRSSDAPGTSAPSPLGLRAGEFIQLVKYAASLANTKLIEFSEVNPKYDADDRTTKLVAIAMHRFCSGAV